MSIINKLWNDSVWSKVIAGILTTYILAALAALKGLFSGEGYLKQLVEYLDYPIPFWVIPLLIILAIIIVIIYMKYSDNNNLEKLVERHEGPYVTFKNLSPSQRFCAVCWDESHRKVQLPHFAYDEFKCPICGNVGCYDSEHNDVDGGSIYEFKLY